MPDELTGILLSLSPKEAWTIYYALYTDPYQPMRPTSAARTNLRERILQSISELNRRNAAGFADAEESE